MDSTIVEPSAHLAIYWSIVTALFAFAFLYAWLIAVMVRTILANTIAWLLMGFTAYMAGNVIIRSPIDILAAHDIVVIQRALLLVIALDAVVMVIQLGKHYNGYAPNNTPLIEQIRSLRDALQGKEITDEA